MKVTEGVRGKSYPKLVQRRDDDTILMCHSPVLSMVVKEGCDGVPSLGSVVRESTNNNQYVNYSGTLIMENN